MHDESGYIYICRLPPRAQNYMTGVVSDTRRPTGALSRRRMALSSGHSGPWAAPRGCFRVIGVTPTGGRLNSGKVTWQPTLQPCFGLLVHAFHGQAKGTHVRCTSWFNETRRGARSVRTSRAIYTSTRTFGDYYGPSGSSSPSSSIFLFGYNT